MPRPRKKQAAETPAMTEIQVTSVMGEPGVFEVDAFGTGSPARKSTAPTETQPDNVIEFRQQNIASSRDWSDVDAILSDVVSFV